MEASLLLALVLMATPCVLGASPGLAARITNQGLEYVAAKGLEALQKELYTITLPDFTGDFLKKGHYEFHSLSVQSCELRHSALTPLPGQGLSVSISDSFFSVQGKWKIRLTFVKAQGSFELQANGISISFTLLLGRDPSGRPTVSATTCSSHIRDVDVDMPGSLRWMLGVFHDYIESKFRRETESKICEMVQNSVTSDLQPYLQTLPVTAEVDSFASIDYSLMEAPRATDRSLDVMFKGEFFNPGHRSPVPFLAPAMSFPEEYNQMVYFTISDYVFNTASLAYYKAGYLNFTITDDKVPPSSNVRLTTQSFRAFAPRLARKYPNMNLELQGALASAPVLTFSPGNLSLAPQIEIEAFVLQPSSAKEPVFQITVATNISAMMTFSNNKITGFLKPGKIQLELKESKVGVFNVDFLEALLNYYILNTLYPRVNEKLAEGFLLPLLNHIQLDDLVLHIHKDFLSLGANVQYLKD
ncbi:lipopolysaccharide-binding protein-like [Sorex fumeus]|uniref:lipopolysaccharide-binding protein-like n=1 Tax=Sorex fumeus TaxID=62283 RepID=UPI0024ACF09D|nr:lipopolysaccharide-binding protein-like [Sorex fumeus]